MKQRLHILHCLRAPVGGLFRHVLDLASAQAGLGHAVGIVADANTADALTRERLVAAAPEFALGVALIPMSRRPGLGDLAAARSVGRIARGCRADVLHGHGAKGGAYARLAASYLKWCGANVKSFYTPHGGSLHFNPASLEGRVYLGLEKVLARCTNGLIFESEFARRIYDERVGTDAIPRRVIANGLKPADFMTHEPGLEATEFLFVGELRHLKGVDILLEALSSINRTRPARATIVGDGPDAARFHAMALSLGLAWQVRFAGSLPVRQAFALGRCLVVPSRAESLPYVVLEAAAAGVPLIATNVGGIPEIAAGTGMTLVPAANVEALCKAMTDFMTAPAAACRRAVAIKSRIAQRYTVEQMTRKIVDFYTELPSAGRPVNLIRGIRAHQNP